MTINSIGNVGIGVVPSTIYASSKALEIAYAGSGLWSYGQTNIYLTSNAYYTTAGAWAYGGTGAASVFQQDGGAFAWKIAGSGTAGGAITFTQAMTFTSGGELFINQLAADGGEAKLRVSQAGSYWNTEFRHTYSTQYWVLFRYNSTGIGSITGNGSNTAFNTSSDIRLKENIKPIENAIEKISKLKPVTYNWKNTGLEDDGFVAQDLLELDEFKHRVNSVGKAEDGSELYGVDYMRFTSILTAAIQELKTQNDALQSRIETLESK
jgi:hypothetical protein